LYFPINFTKAQEKKEKLFRLPLRVSRLKVLFKDNEKFSLSPSTRETVEISGS
jgi:hypothetical protein